ncbi:WD_0033/WD_0034 family tandem repeat-containing protein [Wolbachia endosymbiont (group B) of Schoenobius gigantella]|uniref:WD_0033/WD_0034 family tandem repeat-containing protein n=1 Tax=Wolbachia endosymbiont (group B) of Schoenobius gigantella TaxID=3139313 RepID=UPI003CCB2377
MFWRRTKNENSIAEKFNDDTLQKILTTKIPYSEEGRKGVFTLPCYAISLKNNQAFETFLQEAAKRKFLKDLLNDELTGGILGVQKTTYTVLAYCISEKNSKAVRAVLEVSKENGILKEILDQKMIKEKANSQKISYTLIDYANKQNCKEIVATLKEFKESLNIEVKPVSGNAETSCEDINKDCEDLEIHEPMLASSEEAKNILTKDDIDQTQSSSISTTTFTEVVKRDQTQSCSHSKSRSAENGKSLTEIKHKRKLIKTDTESREKLTDNLTWESKATAQLRGDINKDSELIFETSEKAQNALTEEEPDIPSPTELYFDSKGNSVDEKSSKKAIQPIVAGVVGAVLLASGVALYIMKMPVIEAVVGIAGLVCLSFALYNVLKPSTKLEKVESVEQPIQSSLNLA